MKTIEDQIKVMQHFAAGGQVERMDCKGDWHPSSAPIWDWPDFDYRIAEVDPYAELKLAAADPTKQIRCKYLGDWCEWYDATYGWKWCYSPEHYEIRDKPKPMKKVKLLAWFGGKSLFWKTEDVSYPNSKRVPAEDKEIEVSDD